MKTLTIQNVPDEVAGILVFSDENTGCVRMKAIEVCCDCGQAVMQHFHVHDEVWKQAGYQSNQISHAFCLAARLSRPLTLSDFSTAGINEIPKALGA